MRFAWIFVCALLAPGAAAAGDAQKHDPVLVRAQLLRYLRGDDDILTVPCEPGPGAECIPFNSYFKMRIKVTSALVGELPNRYFDAYVPMHAEMRLGEETPLLFLLADLRADGRLDVRTWDYVPDGLCMFGDTKDVDELARDAVSPAFAGELRAAVRRFPCKFR